MNHFKHIYSLGEHWFKKFRKHYKDIYKFIFDKDLEVYVVYKDNEHVLTYDPIDEVVFTDIPTTNLYESINFERKRDPKLTLGVNYNAEKAKEALESRNFAVEYSTSLELIIVSVLRKIAKGEDVEEALDNFWSTTRLAPIKRNLISYADILHILSTDVGIALSPSLKKILKDTIYAKFVKESTVSFQKHKDPKVALNVNYNAEQAKNAIERWDKASNEYSWQVNRVMTTILPKIAEGVKVEQAINDYYKGKIGKIFHNQGDREILRDVIFFLYDDVGLKLPEKYVNMLQNPVPFLETGEGMLESLSFKRKRDPKKALGISYNHEKANEIFNKLFSPKTPFSLKGYSWETKKLIFDIIDKLVKGEDIEKAVDEVFKIYGVEVSNNYILGILKNDFGFILPEKLLEPMEKEKKLVKEDMGGVSAPMSTLNNTPGMGNAVPASTNSIGSGDKWGNTLGTYTQNGKIGGKKKKKKKVEEENINPYDKVGVAMAKKMKVPMNFTKKHSKKNQNAMKQKKFEHQILTFEEFEKLNENS